MSRSPITRPRLEGTPIWMLLLGVFALTFCSGGCSERKSDFSDIARDQEVVLFPASGRWIGADQCWELEVRGCVYEAERRRLQLALLRRALALERIHISEAQDAIFSERARLFLVDNERGRRVVIELAGRRFAFKKTAPNGQFSGRVRLSASEVKNSESLSTRVVLPPADKRVFAGRVFLFADSGLTVVSDIDDTIKKTLVSDRGAMLKNTFLEPFTALPGMAAAYRAWETNSQAQFWYVSASPWQLFPPLMDFIVSNDFPVGTFHLKTFRWKDESFLSLFQDPVSYKTAILEPRMAAFPGTRFVFVGDAGEKDPEIYTRLARTHPDQVIAIFIRDTADQPDKNRYEPLFRDLPQGILKVFREPAELPSELARKEPSAQ